MVVLCTLTVLFLGWFARVVWQTLKLVGPAGGTSAGGGGGSGLCAAGVAGVNSGGGMIGVALLVKDCEDYVEELARRLASKTAFQPTAGLALVDGGSTDDTPLILERLAPRLGLDYGRLQDVTAGCPRTGFSGVNRSGTIYHGCRGDCFPAERQHKVVRCLDLREAGPKELLNFNMFKGNGFYYAGGG